MSPRIKMLWKEPLLHFLLIGVALFAYYDLASENPEVPAKRIHVNSGQVQQLASNFERTWSRPPTPQELDAMIDSYVREEVFYREAMAMGLDQNDPMVRQRMRMKLEFMLEDLSGQDASDEVLGDFLVKNPDRFREDAVVSFNQVYLNPDLRPDLEKDAQQILARLNAGENPETLGDRTLVPGTFESSPQSLVERDFGDEFAGQVVTMQVGKWSGPVYSPFGAHLVRIDSRTEARLPELMEIRKGVLREYLAEKREEQKKIAYENLREDYEVTVDQLDNSTTGMLSSAEAVERH